MLPFENRTLNSILNHIKGGLIVSCQALPDEPLHGSNIMACMARAAEMGGAVGIRANTPSDIVAIRKAVELPIIGLHKIVMEGYDVYITPTVDSAIALTDAGADIIAIDATNRPHPEGAIEEFIAKIKEATNKPVMADISTLEEAIAAEKAGADIISTTMSGYTPYSPNLSGPDFELIRRASSALNSPVIAEGRISSPEEAAEALKAGAYAVVVGAAITRPQLITARFIKSMKDH